MRGCDLQLQGGKTTPVTRGQICEEKEDSELTASISVNCSATIMGSKDRKLKAGSSSSKPLSSCVAKGQPMCSPEEGRQRTAISQHCQDSVRTSYRSVWWQASKTYQQRCWYQRPPSVPLSPAQPTCSLASITWRLTVCPQMMDKRRAHTLPALLRIKTENQILQHVNCSSVRVAPCSDPAVPVLPDLPPYHQDQAHTAVGGGSGPAGCGRDVPGPSPGSGGEGRTVAGADSRSWVGSRSPPSTGPATRPGWTRRCCSAQRNGPCEETNHWGEGGEEWGKWHSECRMTNLPVDVLFDQYHSCISVTVIRKIKALIFKFRQSAIDICSLCKVHEMYFSLNLI